MFIVHKSRVPKLGEKRILMRTLFGTLTFEDGQRHRYTLYPGDRVCVTGIDAQMCHEEYVEIRELRVARSDGVEGIVTEETHSRSVW